MRKEIKAYGNSSVIVFTKPDLKVYGLKQGDVIDFTIVEVISQHNQNRLSSASSDPHNKQKLQNISKKKEVKK